MHTNIYSISYTYMSAYFNESLRAWLQEIAGAIIPIVLLFDLDLQGRSPNLDQSCVTPCLRSILFMGVITTRVDIQLLESIHNSHSYLDYLIRTTGAKHLIWYPHCLGNDHQYSKYITTMISLLDPKFENDKRISMEHVLKRSELHFLTHLWQEPRFVVVIYALKIKCNDYQAWSKWRIASLGTVCIIDDPLITPFVVVTIRTQIRPYTGLDLRSTLILDTMPKIWYI